jgi:hypothetical protein
MAPIPKASGSGKTALFIIRAVRPGMGGRRPVTKAVESFLYLCRRTTRNLIISA